MPPTIDYRPIIPRTLLRCLVAALGMLLCALAPLLPLLIPALADWMSVPPHRYARRSISPAHSYYRDAVDWGEEWLTRNGFLR